MQNQYNTKIDLGKKIVTQLKNEDLSEATLEKITKKLMLLPPDSKLKKEILKIKPNLEYLIIDHLMQLMLSLKNYEQFENKTDIRKLESRAKKIWQFLLKGYDIKSWNIFCNLVKDNYYLQFFLKTHLEQLEEGHLKKKIEELILEINATQRENYLGHLIEDAIQDYRKYQTYYRQPKDKTNNINVKLYWKAKIIWAFIKELCNKKLYDEEILNNLCNFIKANEYFQTFIKNHLPQLEEGHLKDTMKALILEINSTKIVSYIAKYNPQTCISFTTFISSLLSLANSQEDFAIIQDFIQSTYIPEEEKEQIKKFLQKIKSCEYSKKNSPENQKLMLDSCNLMIEKLHNPSLNVKPNLTKPIINNLQPTVYQNFSALYIDAERKRDQKFQEKTHQSFNKSFGI